MPAIIYSAVVCGLDAEVVETEVDVLGSGLHRFTLVGLPDTAVKESRDRVSSALKNSGFRPPHQCGRITVNLAPADVPKKSTMYDVPTALGFLVATNQLEFDGAKKMFVGELSLDGRIRPVSGVLPIALLAQARRFEELYVPEENAAEAALVNGIKVFGVKTLSDLVNHLRGEQTLAVVENLWKDGVSEHSFLFDMAHIRGQEYAKRALEIAAAGGHNILMSGPPGSGKTLLAKTFPSILPALTFEESLEITKIFSVSGKLSKQNALLTERPFRSPHHSASAVSLVGGGSDLRPGEISLAHRGVLFLDEFAEFSKNILENLRQPLEDGYITVARARGSAKFPSRFMLVAAMNPCPCGNASDPEKLCACSQQQLDRYKQRVSGPILDRIDLHIEVPRIPFEKLESNRLAESSASIRERVGNARALQRERFQKSGILTNSEMLSSHIREHCALDEASLALLKQAVTMFQLSPRAYHRLIKVARTIADLEANDAIDSKHIAEAIQYRFKTE